MFAAEEVWPTNSSVLETCFSRFKYLRLVDFSTLKAFKISKPTEELQTQKTSEHYLQAAEFTNSQSWQMRTT